MNRRIKAAVMLLFLVLGFVGCSVNPKEYPFENKNQQIENVELIYHPFELTLEGEDVLLSVRFLSEEEIPEFMEKVYSLQTKHISTAPHRGWGVYIARVTYKNGDIEYLGSGHIEFVKSGEKPIAQGIYYFPGDAFDKLFLEYAGDFKHLGHEDDTPVFSNPTA